MKLDIFKFLPVFAASAVANASQQPPAVGDVVRLGHDNYLVVFDFNSPKQVEEFQRNVQIMKASAAQIKNLQEQIKAAADAQLKASLESKLKQLDSQFQANDKIMVEGYNFSSSRQYLVRFLKTNICGEISPEEFSVFTLKDGGKIDPGGIFSKNGKRYYHKSAVVGMKENDEFLRAFQYAIKMRAEMEQLRQKLSSTADVEELASLSEKIAACEKALQENKESMREKYGLKSGDLVEVEKSKLMLLLTPEENAKIEAENAAKQRQKN